ncbi:hypothetical protein [Larkinella terrae]|uniref:Glycosyltransferase RgtA/B/C/D-like domain-containing protein n=1 Tax=Larkinella terrae TaxID=2025311 RepID=A0A7K0EQ68_9BACT|nr:hypothetical protein [Larkinella terrae]MRS63711.1 hypothetical protein [Larkinella terrae]
MEPKTQSFPVKNIRSQAVSSASLLLSGLALLVPVLVYGLVFSRYAINVPKFDDHALKAFLLKLDQAESLRDQIYEFFAQHNEHRIFYDRLISWLDYHLTGKLNFVHLMLVGNLSLVLLLLVFIRALRQAGVSLWMALPVSLLLFNLSHWENTFWGMAALQNFTVVALAVATFYELSFKNRVGWLAIALAVLATLTSGNGLLIWPVGLILIFLRQDYVGVLRWLLALAITFRLYFLDYQKPAGNPPDPGSLLAQLHGWLLFNGAAAEAFPVRNFLLTCLLLGGIIIALAAFFGIPAVVEKFRGIKLTEWQLFFLGGAAFTIGTGLVVAFNRVGFGLGTLTTSRYKIYSLTLLAFLFTYGIVRTNPSKRFLTAGLATVFSFLIAFFSYSTFLDEAVYLRQFMSTYQFNFTFTKNSTQPAIDPVTRQYVQNAPAFYDEHLAELLTSIRPADPIKIDSVFKSGTIFTVIQSTISPFGLRDEGSYLLARSAQRTYLFPVKQNLSRSPRGWFWPQRIFSGGFIAEIPETDLARGNYGLFVLTVESGNSVKLHPTGRTITASGVKYQRPESNW